MASANTGTVSARPTQNRRVMSASSGFASSSAVTVRGSSAMPQIGQLPGCRPDDLGVHRADVLGARRGADGAGEAGASAVVAVAGRLE